MDDGGPAIRVLRASVFSALLLGLSTSAHTLVTGTPLSGDTVCTAAVIIFGAALLLTAHERSFAQIALVMAPVEFVLNAAFNVSQQTCAPGSASASAGLWPRLVCGGGTISSQLFSSAPPSPRPVVPMSLVHVTVVPVTGALLLAVACAHLLLSLLAAAWLRTGEKAVFATLSAMTAVLAAPLRPLVPLVRPVPELPSWAVVPCGPERPGPQRMLLHGIARRGPPAPAPVVC